MARKSFHVGETFGSFREVQDAVSAYSVTEHAKLWMRDSRKIAAAKGRVLHTDTIEPQMVLL